MLTKRAQILFDEKTYRVLSKIASKNKSTVGELVRKAVKKTYKIKAELDKSGNLAKAAKGTYGAWKGKTLDNYESASPIAGAWSKPDKVFERL